MLQLPPKRGGDGASQRERGGGLSFFRPRTYRKGYYFYSPQSSTVIKSKMAATTTRTRFRPPKIRLHCRLQTSFRGETSGSIAKCRLFTQSKHVPESTYGMPLDSWMCLGLITLCIGSVFAFWEVFLDSATCFGFWEVFCPYEPP